MCARRLLEEINMALDMRYFEEMEAKIPHGKVRTRFAHLSHRLYARG